MLYLVATPIGNLGDITMRAIDVLKSVDLIASEDTRKTSILLNHYGIIKPQIAYNNFNEKKVLQRIITKLIAGDNVALVTNAGTPGISDPGYLLMNAAVENNIEVTAIPGPSAVIMAVILSGLPMHSFTFKGFPPHKGGPRKRFLILEKQSPHTLVFYESPYRLLIFLKDALEIFGDRNAVIANDLTKKFETIMRGTLSEFVTIFEHQLPRGEYTVVIEGNQS